MPVAKSSSAPTVLLLSPTGWDADAMLGKLTEYFSQVDEPVILVFWGDHYNLDACDWKTQRVLHVVKTVQYAEENA